MIDDVDKRIKQLSELGGFFLFIEKSLKQGLYRNKAYTPTLTVVFYTTYAFSRVESI